MAGSIPQRPFGKHTDITISALGFGGHHLGDAADEHTAIQLVHEAIDGGVTFFDNCWEYHLGKSENWTGKALKGKRASVQMPRNRLHGTFRSFQETVLPELHRRGIAPLGMKPFCGKGEAVTKGVLTPEETLRFAMSLPVATTITGMEKPEILRQNLE